jgi:hypothetical protein
LPISSATDLFDTIAREAAAESPLWADALRDDPEPVPVFSSLARPEHALALETIYEGYLLHYGRPRLFAPADPDVALLLGDMLYAQGLVRISALGDVRAVADLAALISLCAQARADGTDGEGPAWAATAALLGAGALDDARRSLREDRDAGPLDAVARAAAGDDAVAQALAAHARRVG